MRNRFAEVFYELGKSNPNLCLIVADISPAGSIEKFRREFPDRFINTGVAEQIMIGMAAGMSQRGLKPFAYTIATFALYRPFEFIRDDLCYQNLPVTVVGIGGGITYSTLGATHHALEDISIASSIPNMSVIAPCDPLEVEAATRWCAEQEFGPVYLRLGKAGEPNLTEKAIDGWEFGKIRKIVDGDQIAILTYGSIASTAVDVSNKLQQNSVSCSIYFASTLKPVDFNSLSEIFAKYKHIAIIEEHIARGGLASIVKQFAFDFKWSGQMHSFHLKDEFLHKYDSHKELLKIHNLDSKSIFDKLIKVFK